MCEEVELDFHTHLFHSGGFEPRQAADALKEFGVAAIVNLCGLHGERLEKSLALTAGCGPQLVTFGAVDVTRLDEPGFHRYVSDSIGASKRAGMRGLKFFKSLGLGLRDSSGQRIRPDSSRLKPVWDTAAELQLPVLIHIADPIAFFRPADGTNERLEELGAHPDWSFCGPEDFSFPELIEMQEALLANNPDTTFVVAHVGSASEDLALVSGQLRRHPNMYVDIAARISELGRQPYSARRFFEEHQDRILFGTDIMEHSITGGGCGDHYPYYYRFLETMDEHFDYSPSPGQGRWRIYGIGLPDGILEKVYHGNALRLVPELAGALG